MKKKTKWEKVTERLARVAAEKFDELWEAGTPEVWVSRDSLDDWDELDAGAKLSGFVSEEREERIYDGARLTRREKEYLREKYLEEVGMGGGDADRVPAVIVARVEDQEIGRSGYAILAQSGYSFSGVSQQIFGVFRTASAADNWLNREGERIWI